MISFKEFNNEPIPVFCNAGGCQICGEGTIGGSRTGKILEVHHYTPRNQGGTETIDNAVLLCRPCHADVHNNKIESPKPTVEK